MKINDFTPLADALVKMAEGNREAMTCMTTIMHSSLSNFKEILLLDKAGIYGAKISELWNSCGRDIKMFHTEITKVCV